MTIKLSHFIKTEPLPPHITLMLTIGIEFGQNGNDNIRTPAKYSGTGKIIRVGYAIRCCFLGRNLIGIL